MGTGSWGEPDFSLGAVVSATMGGGGRARGAGRKNDLPPPACPPRPSLTSLLLQSGQGAPSGTQTATHSLWPRLLLDAAPPAASVRSVPRVKSPPPDGQKSPQLPSQPSQAVPLERSLLGMPSANWPTGAQKQLGHHALQKARLALQVGLPVAPTAPWVLIRLQPIICGVILKGLAYDSISCDRSGGGAGGRQS